MALEFEHTTPLGFASNVDAPSQAGLQPQDVSFSQPSGGQDPNAFSPDQTGWQNQGESSLDQSGGLLQQGVSLLGQSGWRQQGGTPKQFSFDDSTANTFGGNFAKPADNAFTGNNVLGNSFGNMGSPAPQADAGIQSGGLSQPTVLGSDPFTWTQHAQNVSFDKGDYFSHEDNLYQNLNGKIYQVTGDPMGDVELGADQTAQLKKTIAENSGHGEQVEDGPPAQSDVSPAGDILVAENGVLKHYDANGNLLASYPFTSGVNGVNDPSLHDKGPLPPGEYTLNTDDISEVHGLGYIGRRITGDWGNYRVPLVPAPDTNTYGRSGFYIHGGDPPGSKGCIDVGKNDQHLFPSLKQRGGTVRLTVK